MPKSAKEKVDITALIQGILNGYPGNSAIFREYLQNSDDAKATKQEGIFILDERSHPTESLLDPILRDAQGPALIAMNDGILSDSDWEALKKIHSSSKKADETQTGKNGLGFRASYHLTENPHVLSGDTLMVLDPHHRFQNHPGGISIDVVNEGHDYGDQLTPFSVVVSDPFQTFAGTAFRLPLRTIGQAQQSKIKTVATSVSEIRDLLLSFGTNELEEVILFLKHITSIEIRHINAAGQDSLIGRVTISPHSMQIGIFSRKTTLEKTDGSLKTRTWFFRQLVINKEEAKTTMSKRLGYDIGDVLITDKLTPTIELALPLDGLPIRGALYTLLPLPIKTGFPLHLNAVFALTPDRQSLKNIEEIGAIRSRERRLVEWNRIIFDLWTPIAWADLLEEFSSRYAPWTIWPPAEKSPYWAGLTSNLTKEVVQRKAAIFPSVGHDDQTSFISLDDRHTLLAPSPSPISLNFLSALAVKIVQPPVHIFSLLSTGIVGISAPNLTPKALHGILVEGYQRGWWRAHNPNITEAIIDYIVFSTPDPQLHHLLGLPWFSGSDGSPITLQTSNSSPKLIVPASTEEARLFAIHPDLIEWSSIPSKLQSTLLLPQSSRVLNIIHLSPEGVITVLKLLQRHGISPEVAQIIIGIWAWIEKWSQRKAFFAKKDQFASLSLLPTTQGHFRPLFSKVVLFDGVDQSAVNAWEKLGVPTLQHGVPSRVSLMLINEGFIETPQRSSYIPFLLGACDTSSQILIPAEFIAIQRSLYAAIIRTGSPQLSSSQKDKLASLEVFSVRNTLGGPSILNSVHGTRIHVKLGNDFPLPIQNAVPHVIYVDVRDRETEALVQLLEPLRVHGAIDLLRNAIENWSIQPTNLQDAFIEHIFDNWRKLPTALQSKLEDLPFVTVNDTESRVCPKDLIHPSCMITPLFAGEVGRVPVGRFASHAYVTTMQQLGFLPSSLDSRIVEERLRYFSGNVSHDERVFEKAVAFVQIIGRFWTEDFRGHILQYRRRPWMPLDPPCTLVSPVECRDSLIAGDADPAFYDLVLQVVRNNVVQIASPGLRSALGWSDRIPIEVLVQQLHMSISLPPGNARVNRMSKLIGLLGRLDDNRQFSPEEIESLRSVTGSRSWIPVISTSSIETVSTEYALISNDIDLKRPFRQVQPLASRSFFIHMGCTERPLFETLTSELWKYQSRLSSLDVNGLVALLYEIANHHPSPDRTSIMVPGIDQLNHKLDEVYFPDTDILFLPTALEGLCAVHRQISRALSDQLQIQLLSSLILDLDDDAFGDDEQMAEDLGDRIRGFLKDYDISYAFNEFLANADDAKASEVAIMLDDRRRATPLDGVISREIGALQALPSTIVYNNAILSEDDLKGLRRVGRGAKVDQKDTHGRHGLGALSFYYFTDVATIISGEYFMILDPSGRYLPSSRGQRRTSVVKKIADVLRQYPNQLKPYEFLLNLSNNATKYDGTLFCLPLIPKLTMASQPCDIIRLSSLLGTNYKALSESAFFFTNLREISAKLYRNLGREEVLWSFSANRKPRRPLGAQYTYHILEITSEKGEAKSWLITAAEDTPIPVDHQTVAEGLKLASSNMVVQLAIRLGLHSKMPKSSLFSTLSLPKTTSLPFHLHSRFAISSNRQSIVFDSPDSSNQRDPKSRFNAWILTDIVPSLYLASVGLMILAPVSSKTLPEQHWWLLKSSDEISNLVRDAFHALLANSDDRLFIEAGGKTMLSFKNSVFSGVTTPSDIIDSLILFNAPSLVTSYSSTNLASLPLARTVNAAYVKEILISHVSLENVRNMYISRSIDSSVLIHLLLYVRHVPPLAGLPLLLLSTNIPASIPATTEKRIYLLRHHAHAELFPTATFLRQEYSHERFQDLWITTNIGELNESEATQLIGQELARLTDESQKESWLKAFWRAYDTLPGPPSLAALETAEFRFVRGTTRHFSLSECQPDNVVFISDPDERAELAPTLEWLNIDVLKPSGNQALKAYLAKRFPQPIVNILLCLKKRNRAAFDDLPTENLEFFMKWLKRRFANSIPSWNRQNPAVLKSYLLRLRIWTAYTRQGEEVLQPAGDLSILPSSFSIAAIIPYLHSNHTVAAYSYDLTAFITYCRGLKTNSFSYYMSPQAILSAVEFPSRINQAQEIELFRAFLVEMFRFNTNELASISQTLKIFDDRGQLRPIHSLYDHSVSLFSETLAYTGMSSFIHRSLRNVGMNILRNMGLNFNVSVDTFRICSTEVQEALRTHLSTGEPSISILYEMSRVAFECYTVTLPSKIMSHAQSWSSLDRIAFIRPKDTPRQGASYPAERYYKYERGPLLSPSQFVLPTFEPIAWTQRALFFNEPGEDVTTVNKKLGVPTAHEVVKHLLILTTEIAQSHPGNSTLASDIKATYKWLNDNADAAQQYLVLSADERLFLNVEDLTHDWSGEWLTAQDLVLNLHFDCGGLKSVKGFLQPYDRLLRAAGCETMSMPEIEQRTVIASDSMTVRQSGMMSIFNDMRKKSELTDIVFVPTNTDEVVLKPEERNRGFSVEKKSEMDADEGIPELWGHRAFLAAAIPHFREGSVGWSESQMTRVTFYGSAFGAKALLDFVYTGDFDYYMPLNSDTEGLRDILYELLDILPLAQQWDMPDLRAKVEFNIIYKHKFVQRFLDEHTSMLEKAVTYEATKLKTALDELNKQNAAVLRRVSKAA